MRTPITLAVVVVIIGALAACQSGPESMQSDSDNPAFLRLQTALTKGAVIIGAAEAEGESWEYLLQATSFDRDTGVFEAEISWPTLAAIHLVEGVLTESAVRFTETDYLQEGDAILNCVYVAKLVGDGSWLDGTWGECDGWAGTFFMIMP